jgi:pimeloyl-ACP methyl ester carboxylesterase
MVFVGAPVGDDEWVMEELRIIFGKLVSRLPALGRMRDAGRLQVATQARTLLQRLALLGRPIVWVGHGLGGFLGMRYAARR